MAPRCKVSKPHARARPRCECHGGRLLSLLLSIAALGVVGGGTWFAANTFKVDQHAIGAPSAAAATANATSFIDTSVVDQLVKECEAARGLGIGGVILFGIPETKDDQASGAYAEDGITQVAVRAVKKAVPELIVMTDVCNCEYTSHGHCGKVVGNDVDNDATLEWLAKTAVSHARAGADMVAPRQEAAVALPGKARPPVVARAVMAEPFRRRFAVSAPRAARGEEVAPSATGRPCAPASSRARRWCQP